MRAVGLHEADQMRVEQRPMPVAGRPVRTRPGAVTIVVPYPEP